VAASATEPYISATAGVLRAALRTVRLSMFTGGLVASWFQNNQLALEIPLKTL